MKSGHILALLILAMPAPAFANWNATMALAKLPPMPHDADSAYGQWADNDTILTKGSVFTNYEKTVGDVQQSIIMAMQGGGGMMTAGAVSQHDQVILQHLQPYPGAADLRVHLAAAAADLAKLQQQLQTEVDALGPQEAAESKALPMCPGEATTPEPGAAEAVAEKYATKRVAIASNILGLEAVRITAARQMVGAETAYADHAYGAWSSLSSGMLKASSAPVVVGMESAAIGDVGVVLGYIEDASKDAAEFVAKRNKLMRLSANTPHGCH